MATKTWAQIKVWWDENRDPVMFNDAYTTEESGTLRIYRNKEQVAGFYDWIRWEGVDG